MTALDGVLCAVHQYVDLVGLSFEFLDLRVFLSVFFAFLLPVAEERLAFFMKLLSLLVEQVNLELQSFFQVANLVLLVNHLLHQQLCIEKHLRVLYVLFLNVKTKLRLLAV